MFVLPSCPYEEYDVDAQNQTDQANDIGVFCEQGKEVLENSFKIYRVWRNEETSRK